MKLYRVHLWNINTEYIEEQFVFMVACSEDEAETNALKNFYLDCAEAEEVNEIDGYRIKFEKIESKGE